MKNRCALLAASLLIRRSSFELREPLCAKSPLQVGLALPPELARGALPRRKCAFYILGFAPWSGLWPNRLKGLSPNEGQSSGMI